MRVPEQEQAPVQVQVPVPVRALPGSSSSRALPIEEAEGVTRLVNCLIGNPGSTHCLVHYAGRCSCKSKCAACGASAASFICGADSATRNQCVGTPTWSVDDLMDSTFVRLHLIHFPCKWSGVATSLIGMVSNLQHAMQHAHAHRSLALLCSIWGWVGLVCRCPLLAVDHSSLTVFGCISLSFVAPP